MNSETAKRLVEALSNNLEIAVDNRNKITAFEALLQKTNQTAFEDYTKILQKVRNNPPTLIFPEGFSKILEGLGRD